MGDKQAVTLCLALLESCISASIEFCKLKILKHAMTRYRLNKPAGLGADPGGVPVPAIQHASQSADLEHFKCIQRPTQKSLQQYAES